MELLERVKTQVKAGRRNDRFNEYRELYMEITGKDYHSRCSGCACKFLYGYLQAWYQGQIK